VEIEEGREVRIELGSMERTTEAHGVVPLENAQFATSLASEVLAPRSQVVVPGRETRKVNVWEPLPVVFDGRKSRIRRLPANLVDPRRADVYLVEDENRPGAGSLVKSLPSCDGAGLLVLGRCDRVEVVAETTTGEAQTPRSSTDRGDEREESAQ
jgi:hypothetical protein